MLTESEQQSLRKDRLPLEKLEKIIDELAEKINDIYN